MITHLTKRRIKMKKTVLAMVLVMGLGSALMADMAAGKFAFDMKSTLKANGKADEQMTYLLKNMSRDISSVIVAKDQSVTLIGQNRKGKARKQTFPCKSVSKTKCTIAAGRGMEIETASARQLKLGMKMQNGKMLYLLYAVKK